MFLNSSVSFVITNLIGQQTKVGNAVGTLGFADELVALVACPAWGAISDRLGVRIVSCSCCYIFLNIQNPSPRHGSLEEDPRTFWDLSRSVVVEKLSYHHVRTSCRDPKVSVCSLLARRSSNLTFRFKWLHPQHRCQSQDQRYEYYNPRS